MPLSPDCIMRNLQRLLRGIRSPDKPLAKEIPGLAVDWGELLDELDDERLDAAVQAWLNGGQPFWPTTGQLLQADPYYEPPLSPKQRERQAKAWAEEVWSRVLLAARHPDNPPHAWHVDDATNDAIAGAVQTVGGLKALGLCGEATLAAKRFTFCDVLVPKFERRVDRKIGGVPLAALPPPAPRLAIAAPAEEPLTAEEGTWHEARMKAMRELLDVPSPPTPRCDDAFRKAVGYIERERQKRAAAPAPSNVIPLPPGPPVRIVRQHHIDGGLFRQEQLGEVIPDGWKYTPPRRGA